MHVGMHAGISNALFNTPARRPCPGGCVGCYVSTLGSAMHCSTPQLDGHVQVAVCRGVCGRDYVIAVEITSLCNGRTSLSLQKLAETFRKYRGKSCEVKCHKLRGILRILSNIAGVL